MRKINVAIVTGTRAEFGIWVPVVQAVRASKKLELQLMVTGMHLQREFGSTVDGIRKSGIPIAAVVPMYRKGDSPGESLARATAGLAKAYKELKSDVILVLGDRLEILAAANAALASRLPLAHLHGGETAPGQWDEQIRHAVSKIAHVHFCATATAERRLQRMGEGPGDIHVVGAPALDLADGHWKMVGPIASKMRRYRKAGKIGAAATVLLHPSGGSEEEEYRRATLMIGALRKQQVLLEHVVGPNNDPGHEGILAAYRDAEIGVEMSMLQEAFWTRMATSSFLIGNSSSGIIEAASFGIPVINLGERQKGRERNLNVLDVPWKAGERGIEAAMRRALGDGVFLGKVAKRRNLYGDGHAAARIVKVLESLRFPLATTKQFHDS